MIKLKLTGKFVEVAEPTIIGRQEDAKGKEIKAGTRKQVVIFKEDDTEEDEFSGRVYAGDYWELDIIGDDVSRLLLTAEAEQKHVQVFLQLSSNMVQKKESSDYIYPVNVKMVNFKLLDK
jgi:hypothetical protein